MINDNQAIYLVNEHLAADQLRQDTGHYLQVIRDYKSINKVDSAQMDYLFAAELKERKMVIKLTDANTRWKRLALVQLGAFSVSVGVILILTLLH